VKGEKKSHHCPLPELNPSCTAHNLVGLKSFPKQLGLASLLGAFLLCPSSVQINMDSSSALPKIQDIKLWSMHSIGFQLSRHTKVCITFQTT
jgi:hypothetical protein